MIIHKINISHNDNTTFKSVKNTGNLVKVVTNTAKKDAFWPAIALGSFAGIGIISQQGINLKKLKENAIKYNEKEPESSDLQNDLVNRIMAMQERIKAKEEAGEELDDEDYKLPSSLLSLKMEEGRLPDFSERESDEDSFDELNRIDYTVIDINDFKKEAAIIKNKQLKKIAETICKKGNLHKSTLYYLRDVDAGLSNITDSKILKHLKSELKRLSAIDYDTENYSLPETGEFDYFFSLSSIGEIADVYNTIAGKYSRYRAAEVSSGTVYWDKSRPAAFARNFRKYSPKHFERFINALQEDSKRYAVSADFESSTKTEALEQISNNKEMLDYIYEKYYVSKIPDAKTKKLCKEINRTYGVRVLLSNKTRDINKALSIIKQELDDWTKFSGGKARLPRILDLNICDVRYEDAGAYSNIWGNIHYNGAEMYTHNVIRHEIMHLNEPIIFTKYTSDAELAKLIRSIIPSKKVKINGKEKEVLDWENCKYREEFLKAGTNPKHIEYAYTNKSEFLAVAAEGDLSQYSPEFKEILIKIGMPEYVFNLPIYDADVNNNTYIVQKILKKHPKTNYEKLVIYIEKEREKGLSPRDRLLNAIFGKYHK